MEAGFVKYPRTPSITKSQSDAAFCSISKSETLMRKLLETFYAHGGKSLHFFVLLLLLLFYFSPIYDALHPDRTHWCDSLCNRETFWRFAIITWDTDAFCLVSNIFQYLFFFFYYYYALIVATLPFNWRLISRWSCCDLMQINRFPKLKPKDWKLLANCC